MSNTNGKPTPQTQQSSGGGEGSQAVTPAPPAPPRGEDEGRKHGGSRYPAACATSDSAPTLADPMACCSTTPRYTRSNLRAVAERAACDVAGNLIRLGIPEAEAYDAATHAEGRIHRRLCRLLLHPADRLPDEYDVMTQELGLASLEVFGEDGRQLASALLPTGTCPRGVQQ